MNSAHGSQHTDHGVGLRLTESGVDYGFLESENAEGS